MSDEPALNPVSSSLDPTETVASQGSPRMPKTIGKFQILAKLGEGGMGVVYRAHQESPSRIVALKIMHPGNTSKKAKRRFEFEEAALARLDHPNIARIFESGTTDDGQRYFAMQYIPKHCRIEIPVTQQTPSWALRTASRKNA